MTTTVPRPPTDQLTEQITRDQISKDQISKDQAGPAPTGYNEDIPDPESIQAAAGHLWTGSQKAAQLMDLVIGRNPARTSTIEQALRQPYSMDTLQMAMVVIIEAIAMAKTPKTNPRDILIDRWQLYLDRNPNKPTIALARKLLMAFPRKRSHETVQQLVSTAALIRDHLPGNDLAGPIIQRLTTNRKTLAAYHTIPESAVLMAHLAIDPSLDYREARIADFSAGTGILPMAVYNRLRQLHTDQGEDPKDLHNTLMRTGFTIADIMPASLAIGAANLAGIEPGKQKRYPNTILLHHGVRQDPDGSRHIGLGALDLLHDHQNPPPGHPRKDPHTRPDQQDLVIMNPPFTSQTNLKNADQNIPSPFLGIGPTTSAETTKMNRKMESVGRTTRAGTSCLANHFALMAQTFVKRNGTIALILPSQAVTSPAPGWQKFRNNLLGRFNDIRILSITQYNERDSSFSQDTGVAELMVIARRTRPKEKASHQVHLVTVNRRPAGPQEAQEFAEAIREQLARMGQEEIGQEQLGQEQLDQEQPDAIHQEKPSQPRTTIRTAQGETGTITRTKVEKNADWPTPRVAQPDLINTATLLAQGIIPNQNAPNQPDPGRETRPLDQPPTFPVTTLDHLGHVQSYNNLLDKIFIQEEGPGLAITPPNLGQMPLITGHRCEEQRCINTPPSARMTPRKGMTQRASSIHQRSGSLHISDAFRYNSQSLQAIYTGTPTIAGRGWPGVKMWSQREERIMSVWLNTTIANVIHWSRANHSHHGLGTLTSTKLKAMPVLDLNALSDQKLQQMDQIFEDFHGRQMRPANESWLDNVRIELDRRVTQDVLMLGPEVHQQLDIIRNRWCLEPTVQGNKGKSRFHQDKIRTLTNTLSGTGSKIPADTLANTPSNTPFNTPFNTTPTPLSKTRPSPTPPRPSLPSPPLPRPSLPSPSLPWAPLPRPTPPEPVPAPSLTPNTRPDTAARPNSPRCRQRRSPTRLQQMPTRWRQRIVVF